MNPFTLTSGTIIGREHARLFKNNQDGIGIAVEDSTIAAVVTDGCSEGRSSEVGAKLGASWLASWAPLYARALDLDPARFVPALAGGLIQHLEPLVRGLSSRPGIDPAIVQEFFLFTFLMVVITEARTTVFGVGDGVFAINGTRSVLDAGPDNAPPYLAYSLVPCSAASAAKIHFDAPTIEVESVIVATDGARDLASFDELLADPKYLENPSLLHKRLNVLGAVQGRLSDDTSLVMARRRG